MTVTVLQLSDSHFPAQPGTMVNGLDADVRLGTVLSAWRALGRPLDLVVLTGDNADSGSLQACRRLAGAVGDLGVPVLAVPGNHDDPATVAEVWGHLSTVDVGEWRVVGLDTTRPGQVHGTLDVAAALKAIDGDASRGRPTLVALHHPPRSRSTNPWFQLEGGDELLDGLASRPQVKAVISGHLHDAFELEGPGRLALLGCPSTLRAITHDGDDMEFGADAPTGARILRLEDSGSWSSTVLVA